MDTRSAHPRIGWRLGVGFTITCMVLAVAAGIVLSESRGLLVRSHVLLDGQRALTGLLEATSAPSRQGWARPSREGNCAALLARILSASEALPARGPWPEQEVEPLRADTRTRMSEIGELGVDDPACRLAAARWDSFAVDLARRLASEESQLEAAVSRFVDESLRLLLAATLMSAASAVVTLRVTYRTVAALRQQDAEIARVSWNLVQAQEQASRRLSHELHDDLGQTLAALKARLSRIGSAGTEAVREEALEIVDQAIGSVREISQLMRPVLLDELGLAAGIGYLVERFSRLTGVQASFSDDLHRRLDEEAETQLFRITQEALTNAARHAHASRLTARLALEGDTVVLRIQDDGVGPAQASAAVERSGTGLGLTSMRTRARHCGGDLQVTEVPEGGTCVEARIPLASGTRSDSGDGA